MKAVCLLLVVVIVGCWAQNRPFYAPRPNRYPTLLNRFGETENGLNERAGEGEAAVTMPPIIYVGGSVVDQDLINRVATWPVDKQPFWYVNSQAIQNHMRNPSFNTAGPSQSSFVSGRR